MKPERFLTKVWKYQAQEGAYFCLSTKCTRNGQWKDHFFKWPVKRTTLTRFFKKYSDKKYHLYFCPLPFKEKLRKRELVLGSKLLWSDLDEAHPRRCDPVPQIAWRSSPKRYSALWILNDFHTSLAVEPVNKGLTYNSGADPAGWDLTQVLRIPGLRNQKYDDAPVSELMWFTDNEYRIEDIPEQMSATQDPKEILREYGRKIPSKTRRLLTAKRATVGKRSDIIWRLENELSECGLESDEIFSLVKGSVWNKFAGRKDEDRQLRRELTKVNERTPALSGHRDKPAAKKRKPMGPVVRLSDVEPESVSWLWYPYIPKGKLTIVEGDPGVNKSWFTLALATHLSKRIKFPGTQRGVSGKVLLLSAEDGLGDTVRPRLDSMGADPRKILAYNQHIVLDEVGLEDVEEQIEVYRPKLVIIDPIVAYMGGGIDMHKANETRELTAGLGALAEKHETAIIAVRHLRKGSADKSIYRGLGSIDFLAAARSVLLIGKDPDNPKEGRAIAHIKANLSPLGPTQMFNMHHGEGKPFQWAGTSELTSDELLSKPQDNGKSETELAKEFLEGKLKDGEKKREDLIREGEARSINKSVLIRVKNNLSIQEEKRRGTRYWALN